MVNRIELKKIEDNLEIIKKDLNYDDSLLEETKNEETKKQPPRKNLESPDLPLDPV